MGGGGSWGTLTSIFRAVRPHHRADKCITRKKTRKKNRPFLSYMGPNVKKCAFWAILFIWVHMGGGPEGPLRQTQGYQILRAVRPHHRADKFITRETNNHQFFIYGPQGEKNAHPGLFGGPWVAYK